MPAPASWPVSQDISALAGRLLAHADATPRAGLRHLAAALLRIHPVARAIERRSPALTAWLLQLKDAVAEADDLLDELRRRQLGPPALSSCIAALGRPSHRDLKRLAGRIDRIHSGSERLVGAAVEEEAGAAGRGGVRSPNRVTGSMLTERKLFGRDKECGEIARWLVGGAEEEECSSAAPPSAAVVGHGGMGKTTVAQFVYNDERIERHFDLRAWVCVWDRSDEAELTREILHSIAGADDALCSDGSADLGSLQERLEGLIASKRFLLVLDDVWNDEGKTELESRAIWKKVLEPLRSTASGSKILVTTRMKLVAQFLNSTYVVSLDVLGSRESWLLLKETALRGETTDVPPDLQEIGRAVAAKAKGSPLAAKALGQMLRNTRSTRRWRTLLDTETSHSIIVSSLQLIYQHLPAHLQRCFAYCSIFPRSWRFHRDKLVKIWVALGFIQLSGREGKGEDDLGQEYFDDLLSRSFFCAANKDCQTYYFLDDLMHDLAQHVSAHDCIKIDEGMPSVIPPTVRHLSVSTDYFPQLKGKCRFGRLRTLIILRSSSLSLSYFPSKLLTEFKNLRVLDLSESDILELPEPICQCFHLHYLALCFIANKLPKFIYRLQHIEVLNIPMFLFHDSPNSTMNNFVAHKTSGKLL